MWTAERGGCLPNVGAAIVGAAGSPRRLSTDHDPLFEFHPWKANLQILQIATVKRVTYVPLSHSSSG
jgi:hypothetical protein